MSKLVFKDNMPKFTTNVHNKIDELTANIAIDTERLAKKRVPVNQGPLQSSGRTYRRAHGRHRVEFDKEYAERMEKVVFQNYTTPGTGAHYLEGSGRVISNNLNSYYNELGLVRA